MKYTKRKIPIVALTAMIAPVAHATVTTSPDAVSTFINTPTTFTSNELLANDSSDYGGIFLDYGVLTQPANGDLTFEVEVGSYVYTPNPNFTGTDSFTYSAGDEDSSGIVGTVTITVSAIDDIAPIDAKAPIDVFEDQCDAQVVLTNTDENTAAKLSEVKLAELCANYDSATDGATINPEEVVAQFTSVKNQISAQSGNISKRFSELRGGNRGVSVAGLTYSFGDQDFSGEWLHAIANSIGGAAGADDAVGASPWGVFINGSLSDGERDGTDLERGYDSDSDAVTIGADYRFSNTLVGGVAYGVSQNSISFDGNGDGMDNDVTNLMLYGTWYRDAFNVDVVIGTFESEIETSRQVTVGAVSENTSGKTDSQQTFFSIGAGYGVSNNALSYGPYVNFDYISGEIDAYEETSPGALGLEVGFDEQDVDSQMFTLGGNVSYSISTGWGVIVPHARVEWKKEFDENRDIISGQFIQIANSDFRIEADDFDDSWFHGAIGVSATFRHGLSAYIDYDNIIGYDDTKLATLSYGGRWEVAF
jgi:outer membrane lipase/esterase